MCRLNTRGSQPRSVPGRMISAFVFPTYICRMFVLYPPVREITSVVTSTHDSSFINLRTASWSPTAWSSYSNTLDKYVSNSSVSLFSTKSEVPLRTCYNHASGDLEALRWRLEGLLKDFEKQLFSSSSTKDILKTMDSTDASSTTDPVVLLQAHDRDLNPQFAASTRLACSLFREAREAFCSASSEEAVGKSQDTTARPEHDNLSCSRPDVHPFIPQAKTIRTVNISQVDTVTPDVADCLQSSSNNAREASVTNGTDATQNSAESQQERQEQSQFWLSESLLYIQRSQETLDKLERRLLLSEVYDELSCRVTMSAGAGGNEACDWVEILYTMYVSLIDSFSSQYLWHDGDVCEASNNSMGSISNIKQSKWRLKNRRQSAGDGVGLRSVEFDVLGRFAYGYLKGETGVHKLVRISPYNAQQKRMSSFATVEVVPLLSEAQLRNRTNSIQEKRFHTAEQSCGGINSSTQNNSSSCVDNNSSTQPMSSTKATSDSKRIVSTRNKTVDSVADRNDLIITTMRSGGKGGQGVNKIESAVRVVHSPTGISVRCSEERSQAKNKKLALARLQQRLDVFFEKQKREAIDDIRYNGTDRKDRLVGDGVGVKMTDDPDTGQQVVSSVDPTAKSEWGHHIRSYTLFPYKAVKDLRTKLTVNDVEGLLGGDVSLFTELVWAYNKHRLVSGSGTTSS
eukprot:GHVQ01031906.1.p1 GENE.GHVQ01031906.1~~GHVQ01031906.1.p1  ORF type:complete len:684 (-),score=108.02 GHVQ01031906.1:517-2568(-)